MIKKIYFINAIPVLFWVANFIYHFISCSFQYFNIEKFDILFNISSYIDFVLFALMPIVFVIINGFIAKKHNEYFILNTVLAFANALGYFVYGILYYNFISSDGATLVIVTIFSIVLFDYVFLLTVIGFIIKLLINRYIRKQRTH